MGYLIHSIIFSTLAVLGATPTPAEKITFDSSFEAANGTDFTEVAPNTYSFRIEPDTNSTDRQWYYFNVANAAGETLTFRLQDIDQTNVRSHWGNALPVASLDGGISWAHINGTAASESPEYIFTHTFSSDNELIAFHFPYTWSMVREKIDEWQESPFVEHEVIGKSVEGIDIELLTVAEGEKSTDKVSIWMPVRQHAGEVTSNFVAEGMMDFLLSDDPVAEAVRERIILNIVPMVNPDGVIAGNYRDTAVGINANRAWDDPLGDGSPEVDAVQQAMIRWTALDHRISFFFDMHSTSGASPHFTFHARDGVEPSLYPTPSTYADDSTRFIELLEFHAPHFDPGRGNSSMSNFGIAAHWAADTYGAIALTFESGYAQVAHGPDSEAYLTPEYHREIGVGIVRALADYHGWVAKTNDPDLGEGE